jgi:hypothetical protein
MHTTPQSVTYLNSTILRMDTTPQYDTAAVDNFRNSRPASSIHHVGALLSNPHRDALCNTRDVQIPSESEVWNFSKKILWPMHFELCSSHSSAKIWVKRTVQHNTKAPNRYGK